jgi:hypothetical protein
MNLANVTPSANIEVSNCPVSPTLDCFVNLGSFVPSGPTEWTQLANFTLGSFAALFFASLFLIFILEAKELSHG